MKRVAITGVGAVSPLGLDAKGQKAQTLSRILLASAAVGFGAGGLLFRAASRPLIEAVPSGEVAR